MIASSPLEKALPGRENAKDWLTMKIVECMANPMDEQTAEKLNAYNGAYNAICQWGEEEAPKKKGVTTSEQFSMETAKDWTDRMQNEDGTFGPHWSVEQVKQIMAQRKLSFNLCDAQHDLFRLFLCCKEAWPWRKFGFLCGHGKVFSDRQRCSPREVVKLLQLHRQIKFPALRNGGGFHLQFHLQFYI